MCASVFVRTQYSSEHEAIAQHLVKVLSEDSKRTSVLIQRHKTICVISCVDDLFMHTVRSCGSVAELLL